MNRLIFPFLLIIIFSGCHSPMSKFSYTISSEENSFIKRLNTYDFDKSKLSDFVKIAIDNNWLFLMEQLINEDIANSEIRIEKKINLKTHYFNMWPLDYAVCQRRSEIVKLLLRAGADVEKGLEPPLCQAVLNDDLEIVKILVESGAKVYYESDFAPLCTAVGNGNIEIVKYLLENGANPNETWYERVTALHESQSVEMAKLLVEYGAELKSDEYGNTPLHEAALAHNEPLVMYFISIGADMNTVTDYGKVSPLFLFYSYYLADNFGDSWYYRGNQQGYVYNIHKVLLERTYNVNHINDKGQTLLHIASSIHCEYDYIFVQDLINKGANVSLHDNSGKTPSHYAAEIGNIRILNQLVKAGADLTIKDSNGNSPLDVLKEKYSFLKLN